MSDDNGDAPFENAAPPGATGAGGESIDGRLDSIHRGLSTLGTRIDALVTSTTTYRSALTDRLTEYSNLVSDITRSHAAQLEEYRQANERAVAELRHSLAASEQTLTRVGQRIDELVDDDGAAAGGSAPVVAEVRAILGAQDELRRTIQDSLDRFGEQLTSAQPAVAEQLDRIERDLDSSGKVAAESWGELAGLRAKVDAVLETSATESGSVSTVLDELRETLLDVASGEVVGALWDEFRAARESLDTLVARGAETTDRGTDDDDSGGLLAEVASDIAALRGELSEGLVVEPSEALAGTVDQLRAELSGLDERMRSVTDLRDEVVRLAGAAESASSDATGPEIATSAQVAELGAVVEALQAGLDRIGERLGEAEGQRGPDATQVAIAADVTALRNEVAQLRATADAAAETAPETATAVQLTDLGAAIEASIESVRSGLDGINDRLAAAGDDRSGDEVLGTVAADVTALRDELAQLRATADAAAETAPETATAVQLTDLGAAIEASIESVRSGLDGINDRLAAAGDDRRAEEVLGTVAADLTAMRAEVAQRFDRLADQRAADGEISDADVEGELRILRTGVEGVDGEVRALRSGIEDIIGRLDEGLVLADDITPPAAASPDLGDDLATLRERIDNGVDSLRQLISGLPLRAEPEIPPEIDVDVDLSPITELLEYVRDDLAELPSRIQGPDAPAADAGPEYASIDPDTIDLLREEIRAAGGVSEGLLDAVRNDLVALRRRIKLRAEGELFTDDQLDHIAEAVARRLAE